MPQKSNKLKPSPVKDKKTVKGTKAKPKVKAKTSPKKSFEFDYKLQRVLGFFLVLVSVYTFLSFTSFFVNWFEANAASSLGQGVTNYFHDHAKQVQSWTGELGNIVSEYLILNGFGLGAYFISLLFMAVRL